MNGFWLKFQQWFKIGWLLGGLLIVIAGFVLNLWLDVRDLKNADDSLTKKSITDNTTLIITTKSELLSEIQKLDDKFSERASLDLISEWNTWRGSVDSQLSSHARELYKLDRRINSQ